MAANGEGIPSDLKKIMSIIVLIYNLFACYLVIFEEILSFNCLLFLPQAREYSFLFFCNSYKRKKCYTKMVNRCLGMST